jgi:tetratricopeptide (TPR) repeat protein
VPYFQGQLDQAAEYWQRAIAAQRESEDKLGNAFSLWGLGAVAAGRGQWERAFELLEASLALFRQINDHRYIGIVLNALARAERGRGQPERARGLARQSLAERRQSADRQGLAESFETLAALLVAGDAPNLEQAARLFGLAEALRAAIGAPRPAVDEPSYSAAVAELRRQLAERGPDGLQLLAAAWQSGRALAAEPLEVFCQAALAGEDLPDPAAAPVHGESWSNV